MMMRNFNLSIVIVILSWLLVSSSCGQRESYITSSPKIPNSSYNYNQSSYPRSYQQQYKPASRAYNNPYNYPPRNYYPYYDFDQYYTPPIQYQGNESRDPRPSESGSSGKF
jgi:hypothetical protein